MYDDRTKYGEQIPSLFSWITPEEQKKKANELGHMTDENLKENNKIDNKKN